MTDTNDAYDPYDGLEVTTGNFAKWPEIGTQYSGVITKIYVDTPNFEDAEPCPHIDLNTAEGPKTISATQTALRNMLIERKAEYAVGDVLTVTHSGKSGNAKLFSMEVAKAAAPSAPSGGGQAPPIA